MFVPLKSASRLNHHSIRIPDLFHPFYSLSFLHRRSSIYPFFLHSQSFVCPVCCFLFVVQFPLILTLLLRIHFVWRRNPCKSLATVSHDSLCHFAHICSDALFLSVVQIASVSSLSLCVWNDASCRNLSLKWPIVLSLILVLLFVHWENCSFSISCHPFTPFDFSWTFFHFLRYALYVWEHDVRQNESFLLALLELVWEDMRIEILASDAMCFLLLMNKTRGTESVCVTGSFSSSAYVLLRSCYKRGIRMVCLTSSILFYPSVGHCLLANTHSSQEIGEHCRWIRECCWPHVTSLDEKKKAVVCSLTESIQMLPHSRESHALFS